MKPDAVSITIASSQYPAVCFSLNDCVRKLMFHHFGVRISVSDVTHLCLIMKRLIKKHSHGPDEISSSFDVYHGRDEDMLRATTDMQIWPKRFNFIGIKTCSFDSLSNKSWPNFGSMFWGTFFKFLTLLSLFWVKKNILNFF